MTYAEIINILEVFIEVICNDHEYYDIEESDAFYDALLDRVGRAITDIRKRSVDSIQEQKNQEINIMEIRNFCSNGVIETADMVCSTYKEVIRFIDKLMDSKRGTDEQ